MYGIMVTPLSCGGWGYVILDKDGPVCFGGGENVTQARANEVAREIARRLEAGLL